MFRIVGVCIVTLFAGFLIFLIGSIFYFEPITAFTFLGSIIGILAVLISMIVTSEMIKERKQSADKKPESLIVQKYRTHKSKICPTIDYK